MASTEAVSAVVTMATVGMPEVDGADAATAGVLSDEHGGQVAPLHLLQRERHVTMETHDDTRHNYTIKHQSNQTIKQRS